MTFGDNLTQISLHYGYVRTRIFSEFNSEHFTLENFQITKKNISITLDSK